MPEEKNTSVTYFFDTKYKQPKFPLKLLQASRIYTYLNPASHITAKPRDPHSHWFSEIFFIISGEGVFSINGNLYPARQGDFVFINPSMPHVEFNKNNFAYICVCLYPIRFQANPENHIFHAQAQQEDFSSLLNNLLDEFAANKDDYSDNLIWIYFQEFFLKLRRLVPQIFNLNIPDTPSQQIVKPKSTIIEIALEYIEENYRHDISLDDLSKATFVSKPHLIRLFKNETGYAPIHFINRTRIARSLYFLMRRNDSISNISKQLGFKSSYAYISLFKKLTGYTPEQFRYELINNFANVEHIVNFLNQ